MIEQQYAMSALLIMTVMNFILGFLMVTQIIPIYYGLRPLSPTLVFLQKQPICSQSLLNAYELRA